MARACAVESHAGCYRRSADVYSTLQCILVSRRFPLMFLRARSDSRCAFADRRGDVAFAKQVCGILQGKSHLLCQRLWKLFQTVASCAWKARLVEFVAHCTVR